MKTRTIAALFALTLLFCGCSAQQGATAGVKPAAGVYIQNKGSDTIVNLALAWAERYQQLHADVSLSVTGGGSGTGITALIDGSADIANASRAMTKSEIAAAIAKGVTPKEYVVARDAIAVIVNPNNPVKELTVDQLSLIYKGDINNWKEVGGEDRPIVRLSRETNSGTHVYFLESVIRKGSTKDKSIFSADTLLLPSSQGIISEVSDNPNAIGYDGLGYVTPDVKVLGVGVKLGGSYVLPSIQTVNDNTYPISRDLYMYAPENSSQAIQDYLAWTVSPEAQDIVIRLGFVPVKK